MQVGIMSTTLAANGLTETFRKAAEAGAGGLELAYETANDVKALRGADHAKTVGDLAESTGLAIPSLALMSLCKTPSLIGTESEWQQARKMIGQAIEVAAQLGAQTLTIPFFGKNAIELETELTRAADALLELIDDAAKAGVVLALASTLNFDQQQFLLDHLGNTGDAKICLDTGAALARKLDVPTGIRDLGGEAIAQVHLKDVRIADGQPPDFDVALGEGDVDFRAAIQALYRVGYDGWCIIDTPPKDEPVAAAMKNLQFATGAVAATE